MSEREPGHDERVREAVRALDEGALVLLPFAGQYALAADALTGEAIERAYAAAGKPADEPLTVAVAAIEDARHLAHVTPLARKLADTLDVELLLRAKPTAPDALLAGSERVRVRIARDPLARAIAAEHGPLATATLANAAPGPRTLHEARAALRESVLAIGDDTLDARARPTLVDASEDPPVILHEGDVTAREVQEASALR